VEPAVLCLLIGLDNAEGPFVWMEKFTCPVIIVGVGLSMAATANCMKQHSGRGCELLFCLENADDVFFVFQNIKTRLTEFLAAGLGQPSSSSPQDALPEKIPLVAEAPVFSERKLFISHSIKDEPVLLPVIEYLRTSFGAKCFICADSIKHGTDWRAQIMTELRSCDVFLLAFSAATLESTYCAFEVGVACGMEKQIQLISLDGSNPPAFISHLNMFNLPRLLLTRPWLSQQDVLLASLLEIVEDKTASSPSMSPPPEKKTKH
jgi:hypothetical protein